MCACVYICIYAFRLISREREREKEDEEFWMDFRNLRMGEFFFFSRFGSLVG